MAIHEAQLAEHGGAPGLRNQSLLESALARPRNLYSYSHQVSFNRLAAAYAIGLVKNHPFVDGNKRVGWITCAVFLMLNGVSVISEPAEVVQMMLGAAAGDITEEAFTAWLNRDHPLGTRLLDRV